MGNHLFQCKVVNTWCPEIIVIFRRFPSIIQLHKLIWGKESGKRSVIEIITHLMNIINPKNQLYKVTVVWKKWNGLCIAKLKKGHLDVYFKNITRKALPIYIKLYSMHITREALFVLAKSSQFIFQVDLFSWVQRHYELESWGGESRYLYYMSIVELI